MQTVYQEIFEVIKARKAAFENGTAQENSYTCYLFEKGVDKICKKVGEEAADIINRAKEEGRRVIVVGTTSVRTLESVADERGMLKPCSGNTEIFLYPPYKMKCVDALITNFHLPESTLIMLVACLTGREEILDVYRYAVENKYRFFSFGDACLIL